MRKIAILGGSFDPITTAHIDIASKVSKKYDVDVMFLPAKLSKWKQDKPANAEDRLNMLSLALKNKDRMFIEDLEIFLDTDKENNTIDTMMLLLDKYKDCEFYYVIGTDQLLNLPKWTEIDELIKIIKFIVVEREDYKKDEKLMNKYQCIDSLIKMKNISSTAIRNFESKDAPKEVLDYISKKGLYIEGKLRKNLSEHRYLHSLSVAELAKEIAEANNLDKDQAYVAGLIHDCAKPITGAKAIEMMLTYEPKHIDDDYKIYHQYLAPVVASQEYNIKDKEILHAIKYHTTATYPFNKLDKIIYLADKADPLRDYDPSFYIKKAKEDIDLGFAYMLIDNIKFIKDKHKDKKEIFVDERLKKECNELLESYKIRYLLKLIDEHYGYDIKIYDISDVNPLAKTSIVVTCASERQLLALATYIEDYLLENHFPYHHTEKGSKSGWVLVDAYDIVINLFKLDARIEYNLDELYKKLPTKEYKGEN